MNQRLGNGSNSAAQKVEEHEAAVSEAVLHVVAKDPEIEHVAEKVHPAVVQEHAGENVRPGEDRGNDAVGISECLKLPVAELQFVEKCERVERDQADGDDRACPGWDDVTD